MNLAATAVTEAAVAKPKRRYQALKRRVHPEKASFQNQYWTPPKEHKKMLEQVGKKLRIKTLEDWYKVTQSDILKHGDKMIFVHFYDSSVPAALKKNYPLHQWEEWKFAKVPKHFWDSLYNQRRFFDWLAKQIGIGSDLSGWYKVTQTDISKYKASSLLRLHYGGALWRALMAVYPLHLWKPWLFGARRAPQFKKDPAEQRYYLEDKAQKLGIREKEDWYKVSQKMLMENHLHYFFQDLYDSNLPLALKTIYPEHPWEGWRFGTRLSRTFVTPSSDGSDTS